KLAMNPIHEDMDEAAEMVKPIFGINIVVNSKRKHSGIFCGDFMKAWIESCKFCQKYYGVPIKHEADIVIVSCGGYPKDINLYQGVKTLTNAINALKKGGICIFIAECREGGGAPDFFDWIKPLNAGNLDKALREAFTIAGYIFYASCEAVSKAEKFYMLSNFENSEVSGMGIDSYKNIDDILKQVDFTGKSVYVIPNGGGMLPQMPDTFCSHNAEFK
ncbi:MAG: hypothetical protein Q8873_05360, partial [Bacillota bacterium]|nr:hypothetical protein [Bacillota bacterium]